MLLTCRSASSASKRSHRILSGVALLFIPAANISSRVAFMPYSPSVPIASIKRSRITICTSRKKTVIAVTIHHWDQLQKRQLFRWRERFRMWFIVCPRQDGEYNITANGLVYYYLCTCSGYGLQTIAADNGQNVDELAVTIGTCFQYRSDFAH